MESLLAWLWRFISDSNYTPFWTAMAPVITLLGLTFIFWQIRQGVKSADLGLIFSLHDRFWSPDMVKVRETIKSRENICWLKKLKDGNISTDSIKVYSPEHIPRFTIFDFFESIGALYRRDKRLLKIIDPLIGTDIMFHYKLHEDFYNHDAVKFAYPQQNFKYIAEACIKRRSKKKARVPTFKDIVANI